MSLLQMSVSAGIMIIVIIVARALTINRLPKRTFLILWGLTLAKMLLPFSFPSPFSVYSLANRTGIAEQITNNPTINIAPFTVPQIAGYTPGGASTTGHVSLWLLGWLGGFMLCALYFAFSYFKYHRKLIGSLPVDNSFVAEWLMSHKLKRVIEIRQSSRIKAPLTYGILHPVILMPKHTDWTDTKKLQYVFQHEYVHIQRFDTVAKILLTGALCVHWFNPLAWAMYILANRDLELSCDESVVRSFGETVKSAYAMTLIGMEEQKSGFAPFCNNFSKNAIEERITAIMKMKKTSLITALVAVALIVSVTTAFATSAAADKSLPLSNTSSSTYASKEYERLLSLQFDGYEKMTITAYRDKALQAIDNTEDHALMERMSQDNNLSAVRYSDKSASFLLNTLDPLLAEQWESQTLSSYVQNDFGTLEYAFTCTVLQPDKLTVGEYNSAISDTTDLLKNLMNEKANYNLADEATLRIETEKLAKQVSNDTIKITINLVHYSAPGTSLISASETSEQKPRTATDAEYNLLLSLKTDNYASMAITTFNSQVLETLSKNEQQFNRARELVYQDLSVGATSHLKKDDLAFLSITLSATMTENAVKHQEKFGDTREGFYLNCNTYRQNTPNGEFATVSYELIYQIMDGDKLTVAQRDNALVGVMTGIQSYLDNQSISSITSGGKTAYQTEADKLAKQFSTSQIKISVNTIQFEAKDPNEELKK